VAVGSGSYKAKGNERRFLKKYYYMQLPTYSIIVPVYNSSSLLRELHDRISVVMEKLDEPWEVIYIDDGSTDDSWKVLESLKEKDKENVIVIRLSRNFGQHNATFCGLGFAGGSVIVTIDDDLQMLPEEIPHLISKYKEGDSDLVYGWITKKRHSPFQNAGSRLLKQSGKFFNGSPGEGSSFRCFSIDLAKKLLNHAQNFVFIDELLLWYTDRISFVPVTHNKRKSGRSGYSGIKLFRIATNIVLYYSALPLRIMTWGGFISSILSFIFGVYYIIRKIFFRVPHGYTSIIVAILFSTSIIILCLGIIGEYLNRIYMVQNHKPPFSIRKVLK
jgi:polyisoprenyl-phosphate glycosyltransferase